MSNYRGSDREYRRNDYGKDDDSRREYSYSHGWNKRDDKDGRNEKDYSRRGKEYGCDNRDYQDGRNNYGDRPWNGNDSRENKDGFWNKRVSDNTVQLERFKTFEKATSINSDINTEAAGGDGYSRKRSADKLDEPFLLWTVQYDKPLPATLVARCKTDICGICSVTLSSLVVSKAHYDGKNHDKKVRQELEKIFKDTGEIPPKRKKLDGIAAANDFLKSLESEISPSLPPGEALVSPGGPGEVSKCWKSCWDRALPQQLLDQCTAAKCQLCDLAFTSESAARSHYEGKNHDKKVQKWLEDHFSENKAQMPSRVCAPMSVETFSDKSCSVCNVEISSAAMAKLHYSGRQHRNKAAASHSDGNNLFCSVCMVQCSSAVVYESHVAGKQHKKKLAAHGQQVTTHQINSNAIECEVCNIYVSSEDTLNAHKAGSKHRKKLEMMRKEQESFFCDVCDITVTDRACLEMHLQGAKHRAKVAKTVQGGGLVGGLEATKGPPPQFSCSLCKVTCTDQSSFNLHLQDSDHQAKAGMF